MFIDMGVRDRAIAVMGLNCLKWQKERELAMLQKAFRGMTQEQMQSNYGRIAPTRESYAEQVARELNEIETALLKIKGENDGQD